MSEPMEPVVLTSNKLTGSMNWNKLASLKGDIKRVILHVHRNPGTGVWAMMKHLTRVQNQEPNVVSIIGVPADRQWLGSAYMTELSSLETPYMLMRVPHLFGTGAFLLFILHNPLRTWVRQLRQTLPDAEIVVHSHSAWLTGGYLPLAKDPRIATIATFHGIADDHRLQHVFWLRIAHRFLAQRLFLSDTLLTAVSKETAIRAESIFSIPRNAFAIVPNGMDDSAISQRTSLQDKFVVGHVGQMHEGKGWHLLMDAVDQLWNRGIPVRLLLAGAGQDSERVRLAAKERPEYVQYWGHVPNAGKTLIPQLDALVLATWSEGMPMAIIEAFAAGVPVLATRVGGIPEMIENGVNGLFIERDPDSISRAIERLVFDPELTNRLREGAKFTFAKKFNISTVAAKYDRLYDQALAKSRLVVE